MYSKGKRWERESHVLKKWLSHHHVDEKAVWNDERLISTPPQIHPCHYLGWLDEIFLMDSAMTNGGLGSAKKFLKMEVISRYYDVPPRHSTNGQTWTVMKLGQWLFTGASCKPSDERVEAWTFWSHSAIPWSGRATTGQTWISRQVLESEQSTTEIRRPQEWDIWDSCSDGGPVILRRRSKESDTLLDFPEIENDWDAARDLRFRIAERRAWDKSRDLGTSLTPAVRRKL